MVALIALMYFIYHTGINDYNWHAYTFGTSLKVTAVVVAVLYVIMVSKYEFLATVIIMVQIVGTVLIVAMLILNGIFHEDSFNLSQQIFEKLSAIIIVIQAGVAALLSIKK